MNQPLLPPGQIFAERYRVERFLAQGGCGAVYVAEQLATEAKVALKVLWPQILASAELVEKFKLEARVAGRVESDHIVRVVDATTGMPFMVMELLRRQDLQKTVERTAPIAPELAALYLRQAAAALDKAHALVDRDGRTTPIIHRDLKPENLFLTHREDGTAHVKVLDFGIAKVLSDATKMSQQIKGTPTYMAFEQAAGQPLSPQTDIWALGLIAFFLLTGRSDWRAANTEGAGLTQLFGEVLELPLSPPTQRAVELGVGAPLRSGFDAWFFRCVDRDPTRQLTRLIDPNLDAADTVGSPRAVPPPAFVGEPRAVPASSAPQGFGGTPASLPPAARPLGSTTALAQSIGVVPQRSSAPLIGGGLLLAAVGGALWLRQPATPGRAATPPASAEAAPTSAPAAPSAPVVAASAPLPQVAPPVASSASAPPAAPTPRVPPSKRASPPAKTADPAKEPVVYGDR